MSRLQRDVRLCHRRSPAEATAREGSKLESGHPMAENP
jgi:hypothetical protein